MDPEMVMPTAATAEVAPEAEVVETVHTAPQFKGQYYGIELEIEAEGLYCPMEEYDEENESYIERDVTVPLGWLREQEDSIQGVELISDQPYNFETSVANIERVFEDIVKHGYVPNRTPRGSTHIHANVADLTWEQMKSFTMACAWAEPTLIELAGKGRKGNLFAQSYETTPLGWANIIDWCRKKGFQQSIDTHYMATSFYPMSYLGSVEFRMGPSSRTAEEAIRWLQCIDMVVTAGRDTVVTDSEPPFLSFLMSKLDHRTQKRLRKKASRAASEIWNAIHEPYVKPPLSNLKKKYGQTVMAAPVDTYFNNLSTAIESIAPSPIPALSLDEMAELWTTPITPPPPPIEAYYNPGSSGLNTINPCSDPNCTICNPNGVI